LFRVAPQNQPAAADLPAFFALHQRIPRIWIHCRAPGEAARRGARRLLPARWLRSVPP